MDSERYAPPLARVSDVAPEVGTTQPVRFFPPSGRIGRLRLFSYSIALNILYGLCSVVLVAIARPESSAVGIVGLVLLVVYGIANLMVVVQRSHDMNMSGWWCLLTIIPLAILFWLFNPGTRGNNRWGAPPPPNTLGVKLLAWLLPGVVVLGIVAAIALPAYQKASARPAVTAPR